jgi:hypothetical protein
VLEERWVTKGGETVLTKRAIELEVGHDVPALHVPKAEPLSAAQGNGAVKEVPRDQAPPFAEVFHLDTPKGWTFVGRYAVQPARLNPAGGGIPDDLRVALYTDVWRRGPDLLLLDQGATTATAPPFDAKSALGPLLLKGLGDATLAVDLRIAEVRFSRADGGFARLAGTIDPKALVDLAGQLTVRVTPR